MIQMLPVESMMLFPTLTCVFLFLVWYPLLRLPPPRSNCHPQTATNQLPPTNCHQPAATNQLSPTNCYQATATNQLLPRNCHQTTATNQLRRCDFRGRHSTWCSPEGRMYALASVGRRRSAGVICIWCEVVNMWGYPVL